jgi:hypothetical protein
MDKLKFLMPIGFLAITAGLSAVVMLMSPLFGLGAISFWQALWVFSVVAASCSAVILGVVVPLNAAGKCFVVNHSKKHSL